MDFGATIRAWRNDADLSLRELSHKVGIGFTQLSKIETGALGPPSDEQIRALARVLGRTDSDADELVGLAHQTKIPTAEVRDVLVKNPEVGALLRRIQQRQRPLSEQETDAIKRIAPVTSPREDGPDGPA